MTYQKTKVYPPTKPKPYWLIKHYNGVIEVFKTYDEIPLSIRKKLNL